MCPDVRWSAVCSLKGLLEMARPSGEVKKNDQNDLVMRKGVPHGEHFLG